MSVNNAIEVSVDAIVMALLGTVGVGTRDMQEATRGFNLLADIPWRQREQVRTIEGHLAKAEDIIQDMLWSIGTDEAVEVIEAVWGPLPAVD